MTICEHCAAAAEGQGPRLAYCRTCGRRAKVYRDDAPEDEQAVVVHKHSNTRVRCQGSRKPPVFKHVGHEWCDGCPCQHRPSGSWNKGS